MTDLRRQASRKAARIKRIRGQAEAVQTEGSSTGQETEPARRKRRAKADRRKISFSAIGRSGAKMRHRQQVLKAAIARFEENNPGCKVEGNWAGRDVRDILRSKY